MFQCIYLVSRRCQFAVSGGRQGWLTPTITGKTQDPVRFHQDNHLHAGPGWLAGSVRPAGRVAGSYWTDRPTDWLLVCSQPVLSRLRSAEHQKGVIPTPHLHQLFYFRFTPHTSIKLLVTMWSATDPTTCFSVSTVVLNFSESSVWKWFYLFFSIPVSKRAAIKVIQLLNSVRFSPISQSWVVCCCISPN